jgi:hypothetical protein
MNQEQAERCMFEKFNYATTLTKGSLQNYVPIVKEQKIGLVFFQVK